MEILSKGLSDTAIFAEEIIKKLEDWSGKTKGALVMGLYGDLGSGKTTFTQYFGKLLGIDETMASPTFVIEKIYKIEDKSDKFDHLIHIDAYRIESAKEIEMLGFRELLVNPRNIIMIEWPEKISEIMPAGHIKIRFEHADEFTRKINIEV